MVRTTRRASLWVGQSKRLYITSCFWVHRRSSCQETERDRVNHRERARPPGRSRLPLLQQHVPSGHTTWAARMSMDTCPSPDQRMCPSEGEGSQDFPPALYLLPNISPEPLRSSRGRLLTSSTSSTVVSWEDPWERNRLASSAAAWLAVALLPVSFCSEGKRMGVVHSKDVTPLLRVSS